jgi:ubiquinone/menaquinone biosynthesis C-methylase UbiE
MPMQHNPGSPILYNDGAAYERMMGVWSSRAGAIFLDWLSPAPGLRWIDIGCGSGAFTELIVDGCAPREVQGVDPSDAQLDFARKRPAARLAQFQKGEAMALPFADQRFDVAAMALVIFFVPDPAKGVAEMRRVVAPGGTIATYAWDMPGGGFPQAVIHDAMRAMGLKPLLPPNQAVSRMEALAALWRGADLEEIDTREITVERSFEGFDEFWEISQLGSSIRPVLETLSGADLEQLKDRVRARLAIEPGGRITCSGRANAITGRVAE